MLLRYIAEFPNSFWAYCLWKLWCAVQGTVCFGAMVVLGMRL